MGFLCTVFNQIFSALLVDIFPENPSSAAASGNITRCALSAAAVAVLQPLDNIMGRGWFFTLLSIVSGVGGAAAVLLIRIRGKKWRGQRASKTSNSRDNPHVEDSRLEQVKRLKEKSQKISPLALDADIIGPPHEQLDAKDPEYGVLRNKLRSL